KIHGSTPDEVHFHEVGAVDSIIDIVGTAICIDLLAPDKIFASVLHDGHGFVQCQHGTIPVPVPAVTEVLAARGAGFKQLDVEGELMTPTGAAIIAELAESFGPAPEMKIIQTGYGAGTKDFPIPNLLRIVRGEPVTVAMPEQHTVTVIEANIDDSTPEILGYVMERLFEAGVRDVFFTPVYMKKCRPATWLHVLCDEADVPAMERILFTETSTIGLRKYRVERTCLPRRATTVSTPYGDVRAKETTFGDTTRISVEYDDARRIAREKGIPLQEVYGARSKTSKDGTSGE
ncbi:MAG: nickel pincer cofactor biosynthesis protein LarC, partial [Tannerella sp.]|nr:nickel pincer cofactor biosynthesis protein LarC [Tannerella sp.]